MHEKHVTNPLSCFPLTRISAMKAYGIFIGLLAFLLIQNAESKPHKSSSSGSSVQAIKKSATQTTTKTEVTEEQVEETVVTTYKSYFIQEFSSWKSTEKQSAELKETVSSCFSHVVNGNTYWDKIAKNQQYVEYLAIATGYTEKVEVAKVKAHCVKIAASKPRLLALAFKSISKHMKDGRSTLTVSKLATSKYKIGHNEVEVSQDWKAFAIAEFLNFKSEQGNSKELIKKVTKVLEYDHVYFEKFIQKKIYAEYLAYATSYNGNIKNYKELEKHLKYTAKTKPRLVAVGLKYLCKNLKNSKEPLVIAPLAKKRFGIKEKTITKVDWKSHFIKEYIDYKSTKTYKEADQRLRVSSMLKYQADSGTILDIILKKKQYKEFFAKSIGYSYQESSFNEQEFKEYIKTTSELYPTLVSLSFRSICKNLQNPNEQLVIAASAQKIIQQHLTTKTEKKTTTKKTTKTTKTTVTKTWTEYVISEFATFKSISEESDETSSKIQKFLAYNTEGQSCLEQILKKEYYAEYLAYSTGYNGDYHQTKKLSEHLTNVGKTKPRLLAAGLKQVTQNIQNKSQKLVVSKVAMQKYHIKNKTFEFHSEKKSSSKTTKTANYYSYLEQYFSSVKESEESDEVAKFNENFRIAENGGALEELLTTKEYYSYLVKATKYKGQDNYSEFRNYLQNEYFNKRPKVIALLFKQIYLYNKKKASLEVPVYCKTYYEKEQKSSSSSNVQHVSHQSSSSSHQSSSSSHKSTSSYSYVSYLEKYFSTIKESEESDEVANFNENFRTAENGSALEQLLKNNEYYKYLVKSTKYSGQDNVSEFRNYLQNEYFNKRPKVIALLFKQIYLYNKKTASLEVPTYCKTYYEKEQKQYKAASSVKQQSSSVKQQSSSVKQQSSSSVKQQSSSVKQQSSSSSVKQESSSSSYQSTYLKSFVEVNSESSETTNISSSVIEFAKSSKLEEILKESSYAQFLATTLQYSGDCNSNAFKTYIREKVLKERPLALALSLKKIYYHVQEKRQLVIPAYVTKKYQVTSTYYSSSSTTTTSSSSSSSSSSYVAAEESED